MAINDLGIVRPGSSILIPFPTYDSNDPSDSVIVSAFVLADIGIYKGTSMTERASTTGVVLLDTDGINIDGAVGIHGFSIDLSSNATAGFYAAGSQYYVTTGPMTVDGAITVSAITATFRIGYPGAVHESTIAVFTSTDNFTLTDGSADDDAYNGWTMIAHDVASAIQVQAGIVEDYTGSSKTVNLFADPGVFTMTAADNVSFFPPTNVYSVQGTVQTAGDVIADTELVLADAEAILLDTEAVVSDTESGTFGLAVLLADTETTRTDAAAILVDTEAVPATITTLLADTEQTIADGITIISDTEAINTASAAVLVDTEAAIGERTTISLDTEAILVDTNTTLDIIVDAILVDTETTRTNVSAVLVDTEAAITERSTLLTDTEAVLSDTELVLTDTEAAITERSTLLTDTEAVLADSETINTQIGTAGAGLTDLGGMSTGMKAEVNVEALDVLVTDTHAEPSSVVAATTSIKDALMWLKTLSRNKGLQTGTVKTLRNDADSADIATSVISDDEVTFTRGEWS